MGLDCIFMEPMADSGSGQYFCLCSPCGSSWFYDICHFGLYYFARRHFYQRGGKIQNIIDTKTGVADIRSATIIDFIYAFILLVFKEWSNIPMSTTWVFWVSGRA